MTAPAHRRTAEPDAGFTLIEVIFALALIGIIAGASLTFFVGGTRSVTTQQRQQNAAAVATEAMEDAYAHVATTTAGGVTSLVIGRTQAEATAAWNTAVAAGVSGLADAYVAWDTATTPAPATGPADDAVALTRTVTKSNMPYTATVLIGQCYRAKANAAANCTRTGGDAAGVAQSGYTKLARVAVRVTWADVNGLCGGTCSYTITALVDPSTDLEWNNTTRMLAADDSMNVDAGTSIAVRVLDNDTLPKLSSNPVSIISQPAAKNGYGMGTASVDAATGIVTYTASVEAYGEVTFMYKVDVGARTAQATVHAYVRPKAQDYSLPSVRGVQSTQAITTRTGDAVSSVTLATPTPAGASVSGTSIRFTPASAGTYTISYTYTDANGTSLPGTITSVATNYAAPVASNQSINVPVNSTSGYALNLQTATGNGSTYRVKVMSLPGSGQLKVDGSNASVGLTGTNVTFTPASRTIGWTTFNFQIVDPDGKFSGTATATLLVSPTATADTVSVARNGTRDLDLGSNDGATQSTTFTVVSNISSSCGTLTVTQSTWASSGKIQLKAANVSRSTSCNFTYKLVPAVTGVPSPGLQESATVTVAVTVS